MYVIIMKLEVFYFMSKSSAAKKSIIVGGLIGTGGLFVSKLIGLAYTIPFSYILQSEAYQSVCQPGSCIAGTQITARIHHQH